MNIIEASLLGWMILIIWCVILFVFKRFCLDKIKSGFIKYLLGMIFAYGILLMILIASEHSIYLRMALQEWRVGIIRGMRGSILLIILPGLYSIFLIKKGYFKEGGSKASWKWKLQMMASIFFNAFGAFFSMIFISFLLQGHSFSELLLTIKESFQYIEWGWTLAFIICCGVFVFIMWLDHKKQLEK